MKIVGKILKALLCIVGVLVLLLVLAVGVFTVAEYRPADTESVIAQQETEAVLETGKPLTIVSWNCGYGALGDNADFFMDGGSSVYTADRARVESNLAGIRDALKAICAGFIAIASAIVSLVMFMKLADAFSTCRSPFDEAVIKRMNIFAWTLIVCSVVGACAAGAAAAAFSGFGNLDINVSMNPIFTALIVFFLCMIFRYGATLQQEADETL